jgi:hypothetical protein
MGHARYKIESCKCFCIIELYKLSQQDYSTVSVLHEIIDVDMELNLKEKYNPDEFKFICKKNQVKANVKHFS